MRSVSCKSKKKVSFFIIRLTFDYEYKYDTEVYKEEEDEAEEKALKEDDQHREWGSLGIIKDLK